MAPSNRVHKVKVVKMECRGTLLFLLKEVGDEIYSLMRFIILSCKVELKPDKLMRETNKDQIQLDAEGKIIGKDGLACKAYKIVHSQEKNDEFLKLKGESVMKLCKP